MNIFVLDKDPAVCAQYHVDKHVVKMILETAQLLCSAHWMSGNEAPYRLTHKNHPCSTWVRASISNYRFLCDLGLELCREYEYRYGRRHKTADVIDWCLSNVPNIPDIGFTRPALAMPDEYKVDDVVESYRNYYRGEKSGFASWKKRRVPHWYSKNKS